MSDDGEKPRPERCATCRFWNHPVRGLNAENIYASGVEFGECRKRPPQFVPFTTEDDGDGAFANNALNWRVPVTMGIFWCGEWRAKDGAVEDVLSIRTHAAGFSIRARKAMNKLQVNTLGELVNRTARELIDCHGVGDITLKEVRENLALRGLKLKGDA